VIVQRPPNRTIWFARTIAAFITLPIPLCLLWMSFHERGVDLSAAVSGSLSLDAYLQFLRPSSDIFFKFWAAMLRGLAYSFAAGLIAAAIAICFVGPLAFWSRSSASTLAYSLLGLTLLPQTFLVLAILQIASIAGLRTASSGLIIATLALALAPLACWISWLVVGADLRVRLVNFAIDRVSDSTAVKVLVDQFGGRIAHLFAVVFALALGNFIVPFSLGDNSTYTGLVLLLSFSSNLGRDWATIGAAGTMLLLPVVIVSVTMGLFLSKIFRTITTS
jgi:ABC-type glycerol-3-phosphate transport system permease component